jgi:RNA repair pathway DNA polymerase beta family
MKLICQTQFGSHLYGTATESSDIDVRGVFMPASKDVLLGKIPKTNRDLDSDEYDYELYSLHHFLRLAQQGQTLAIDMLWTPFKLIKFGTYGSIWEDLVDNRLKFLSKNMTAFIGYAKAQSYKYSMKGDKLNKIRNFHDCLLSKEQSLGEIWDNLPKDEERRNPQGIRELQIAGKWFGETTSTTIARQSVDGILEKYGQRTKMAASFGGADWKALSHAVRVSAELIELLDTKNIVFPLANADELLKIKLGQVPFEKVQDTINVLLNIIEIKMKNSDWPQIVDSKFWDQWLYDVVKGDIK